MAKQSAKQSPGGRVLRLVVLLLLAGVAIVIYDEAYGFLSLKISSWFLAAGLATLVMLSVLFLFAYLLNKGWGWK